MPKINHKNIITYILRILFCSSFLLSNSIIAELNNTESDITGGLNEKTSLDYRDATFVDVIRHIADAAHVNIVISPNVITQVSQQKVNLRLTEVTYDKALQTILNMYHLGSVLEENILRIDTLDSIKKEKEEISKTKEEKIKLEPTKTLVHQLNFAKSTDIAALLTKSLNNYINIDKRVTIQADNRSNKILIEGTQEVLIRAKSLLDVLDKRKQQLQIEARIVEASNEFNKQLKVSWGTRFGLDGSKGLTSGIIFPNTINGSISGAGAASSNIGRLNPTDVGTMGITLGSINGIISIDAILKAYETDNITNIIANPSVTIMDNEKASFEESLDTTRYGTSTTGVDTTRTTSSKLLLNVTPQIASDNSIELSIEVQRDSPLSSDATLYSKIGRSVKTKLVVKNGDTVVLGGLYQTYKSKEDARLPYLGSIPIIGWIFRQNSNIEKRTELMVFVTPRIISDGVINTNISNNNPLSPPANQLVAPANQLVAPANQFAAPANQLAAPANQLEAPANQLEAPANQLEAPANQLEDPSQEEGLPMNSNEANASLQDIEPSEVQNEGNQEASNEELSLD